MSEFKEKVTELVGQMTQADDGKWTLPEDVSKDLDEPTLYAVTAERRYRDTQGAYTKAQQEALAARAASKKHEAIAAGYQEKILAEGAKLTTAQRTELAALKASDPEAWRAKLNTYETVAQTTLQDELKEIAKKSSDKGELAVRGEQMAAWSESTGIELTNDIVDNDLPPRFKKELSEGKVTFEEFLEKAGNFLKQEKIILGSDEGTDDDTLSLGRVAGGQEPDSKAQAGDFDETYSKTLF